jgi:uncharacterized protein DUF6602
MSVVEDYWGGVLRRLQAEVDVFNRLIGHMGEMGRENELALARLLQRLVPARYGIGSGLLIDAEGHESRQMDVVVYDQADEPAVFAQTSQVLFPVENVRACIEVKSTIDKKELEDAGRKKMASITALRPRRGERPLFALVAYRSSILAEKIAEHILSLNDGEDCRPDIVCVVELGLFAVRRKLLRWSVTNTQPEDYVVGLACLHERDDEDRRIAGNYRQPVDDSGDEQYVEGGSIFPIVTALNADWISEPSRALLQFCDVLVSSLAAASERREPSLSYYVTDDGRDLLLLNAGGDRIPGDSTPRMD